MTTLRRKRGDTIRLEVGPVVNQAGQAQDLSGSVVRFTAKDRLSDADGAAILTATGTIRNQATDRGYADVEVPASATDALTAPRTLHWDVQVTQPDGFVATLDAGLLLIEPDVTRTS